jgi:hypothetical protein
MSQNKSVTSHATALKMTSNWICSRERGRRPHPAAVLAASALVMLIHWIMSGTVAVAQSPLRARTEQGHEVILRNDGSWVYGQ